MSISKLMKRRVVTVEPDDTLKTIRDIFDQAYFRHLLVLDHGRLVGVISDRDLLRALSPHLGTLAESDRDRATLNRRAHQIMTRKPVTVTAVTSVKEAVRLMLRRNVSCLPVVGAAGEVEGILTWKDIARLLVDEQTRLPGGNA